MNGYRIRLADGSEIGPMDMAALRTWIAQGAVDGHSLVMAPGTRRWVPLGSIREFQGLVGPSPARAGGARSRRAAPADDDAEDVTFGPTVFDRVRHLLVALLLLATAAAFGWLAHRPDDAASVLDGAPWLELALGALALALALVPAWRFTRRAVRVVLLLASFALFPLVGILLAQGQRGLSLLTLAGAWLFMLGLWVLLRGEARILGSALALLVTIGGAVAAVRFGYVPQSAAAAGIRGWTSPDRAFRDEAAGLTLNLPAGWLPLRTGNPFVTAPDGARVVLAQPRQGGFAWLISEPAPQGVSTAEAYLGAILARRRKERPGYEAAASLGQKIGVLSARRATAAWTDGDVRQRELVVAGLDGWMAFALVGWMPEAAANRSNALDALADGLGARGVFEARLRQSVEAAVALAPHLTSTAAEQLMARSEARVLDPEQAFHRSLAALAKRLASLSGPEASELARLTTATYAGMPWAERGKVAAYIERLRRDEPTSVEEDRAMARLFQGAERRLSQAQLLRLQAYYDKAILG